LAFDVSDLAETSEMFKGVGYKHNDERPRKGVRFVYLQGASGPIYELIEKER